MGGQFLHRLPQGAIAEVALGNAEKLGTLPVGTQALEVVERRDAVVDPCCEENPRGVA